MKGFIPFVLTLVLCFHISSRNAAACPLISGLVDFNCNEAIKIAVVGDSIVKGTGDLRFKNRGGYVKRLGRKFKNARFVSVPLPGYTTRRIFSEMKSKLAAKTVNSVRTKLVDADLVVIDAGRNDFFEHGDPEMTLRNLKRLVAVLRKEVGKLNKVSGQPFIVVATLLPTTRGFQRSFINNVNLLLHEFSSGSFPVGLFFDQISDEFISVDGIHPSSAGYDEMARIAESSLLDNIAASELVLRPDLDEDGVYDRFEKRFSCNPNKKDTDRDGIDDGVEIFDLLTNPSLADTDGDGIDDGSEVANGSDPLTP